MTNNLKALKPFFASLALILAFTISAQDSGFIYGKITTEDGDTYEGPIRWGKEEVYWTDMFNVSKRENKNLDYLSNRELEDLEDRQDGFSSNGRIKIFNVSWDFDDYDFVHEFSCQFGNIKSIRVNSSSRIELKLRNGDYLELRGEGYNDVGAKLRVIDEELGTVQISWSDVEQIDFMNTPNRLDSKFGTPLYGKVESDLGTFTGFVQWDHDERVGTDVLDGEDRDRDYEIAFEKIESIERDGYSSSIVKLKSGRELDLRGTNDVDDDNKGIIVSMPGFGRVDLEWEDFDKVTFMDAPDSGPSFDSFSDVEKITGTVTVDNGDVHSGQIIFDLDEEYTFEVLNGEDDDTKYIVPFKNIASISPRGSYRSTVELKNGKTVVFEESQDVSEDNQGLLVKTNSGRVYVPWDRVEKIDLK
ncbi:MAG: hypothetical protein AB8B73_08420 [Ekhidna sp.]